MAGVREFGRRQTPPGGPAQAYVHDDPLALSPEAENFRLSLGATFEKHPNAFKAWWEAEASSRMLLYLLNGALVAPGLLCAALGQGYVLSGVAEALGLGVAFWLRRERRRRLKAIAQWSDGADDAAATRHFSASDG